MTTAIEGSELTQTGPGSVMGELMRQYWIPAALSSELVSDGAPVRLMLLGEKLIAFRDSSGKVGVMDHRCPHRAASLFLGRNEEDGIGCIYHGWKFDVPLPIFGLRDRIRGQIRSSTTVDTVASWEPMKPPQKGQSRPNTVMPSLRRPATVP